MTDPIIDVVGWIAGALVLTTFYLRTMMPLRCVAIASNIAFVSYGLLAGALPIVVLHMLLLPLNVLRLQQMRLRIRRVQSAARGSFALDTLVPYMEVRRVPGGTTLFEKGEYADAGFLVLGGRVRIVGKGAFVKAGQLVGVLEIFAPDQRRRHTAVCEGDVELASMAEDRFWEFFHQKPEFGAYLLRLSMQHGAQELASGTPAWSMTPSVVPIRDSMRTAGERSPSPLDVLASIADPPRQAGPQHH